MSKHLEQITIAVLLAASTELLAANVTHLSFDEFAPTDGTCALKELGFMSNPRALQFSGKIKRENRGFICSVSIPQSTFERSFQYCAISFVEASPASDYVCGVTHLGNAVEFLYGFKYGSIAPPMCSFVCVRK